MRYMVGVYDNFAATLELSDVSANSTLEAVEKVLRINGVEFGEFHSLDEALCFASDREMVINVGQINADMA